MIGDPIPLAAVRQKREQTKAAAQTIAGCLVDMGVNYGRALVDEALLITQRLPDPDRHLARTVEGFILRRGFRRLRKQWREELSRENADAYLKIALPIVRDHYWAHLDERDPLTCKATGAKLIRAGGCP